MLASLTTPTFDPLGVVQLDVERGSVLDQLRRRVNRQATLDGGVTFADGGYTEADRTITLRWMVRSADEEAAVARLVRLYSRLRLATLDGVYLVAPEVYIPGPQESTLTLLVAERLDE